MQALLNHFAEQSLLYSLLAVALVAFLESLVLVGLILPGALMMAGLGALIGAGKLNLYQACLVALVACVLADWISFAIGWKFKNVLRRSRLIHRYRSWLDKTEYALHQHNMLAILAGRFIGPTRPLLPAVAGMLSLSPVKFALPSLIGGLLWPPVYFMPGILAGVAIDIPANHNSWLFKWLLLLVAVLAWLAIWLCWRVYRFGKQRSLPGRLSAGQWRLLAGLASVVALAGLVAIQYHPLMPVYRHLLWQVLTVSV